MLLRGQYVFGSATTGTNRIESRVKFAREAPYRRRSGRADGPTWVRSHFMIGLESRRNWITRSFARGVPSHEPAGHSRHVISPF
jgi:hypothetical protein